MFYAVGTNFSPASAASLQTDREPDGTSSLQPERGTRDCLISRYKYLQDWPRIFTTMKEDLQEFALNKQFDVVDVINKTYADSTEYDLNDALIYLTKAINKTKIKNKQLVKQHFGRFVQCRIVLEEIWLNIRLKGYDREFTSELEENIKAVEKKFGSMTSNIVSDSRDEARRERREHYIHKYSMLFNVKAELQKNLNSPERFVDAYESARSIYRLLEGSEYVRSIWGSIHDERCEFLETVYGNIQRPGNSFSEALYYFDLYFRVCEQKTEDKIMNTLLVNFKENTSRSLDTHCLDCEEFMQEAARDYLRLVKKVEERQQIEATLHYFSCVEKVFEASEIFFAKIWMRKMLESIRNIELFGNARNVYFSCFKKLKQKMIDDEFRVVPATTVEEFSKAMTHLKTTFSLFMEIASKEEQRYLRYKLLGSVTEHCSSVNADGFQNVEKIAECMYDLKHLLGSEDSEIVKDLYGVINKYVESQIASIADALRERIKEDASDAFVLMEVVRMIESMPAEYIRVLKRVHSALDRHPVALYYLSGILQIASPDLSNLQRMQADEVKDQFGFLLDQSPA